jgi:hypothetical protein
VLVLSIFFFAATATAQSQAVEPSFDSRALESATVISGGTCSNPLVGIS